MRYFSLLIVFFIPIYSWAIDYRVESEKNDIDQSWSYVLSVTDGVKKRAIWIPFEGNAFHADITGKFNFSCPGGKVDGVKITSTSTSIDGTEIMDEFFFFDKQLNNIYAKQYIRISEPNNKITFTPISLKHTVCKQSGSVTKNDPGKFNDHIEHHQLIIQGPFLLKDIDGIYIKYIIGPKTNINPDYNINLIREDKHGESIIADYKKKNEVIPDISTVFFTSISGQNHLINLVYWGVDDPEWLAKGNEFCYQVYAYRYDQQGNFSANPNINNDPNLSGCDKGKQKFNYNTAVAIKAYLKQKYSEK